MTWIRRGRVTEPGSPSCGWRPTTRPASWLPVPTAPASSRSTGIVAGIDWYDWSADDSQLAIYHLIDGDPSISIVAADGSGSIKALDLGDIEPGDRVDWRPPDGRRD